MYRLGCVSKSIMALGGHTAPRAPRQALYCRKSPGQAMKLQYSALRMADELLHALGARIRELRRERGWSRRELGSRSGVSERFLAEVESGRGNPSVRSLAEIASALGTSAAAVLTPRSDVVALLGIRGAGKSTVGRALAKRWKTG